MHRDRTPIIVAGATAVVSCGLLALAISRGWLGADVGRGANFCEAARGWAVRQPANTFSNAGFVTAGLLIAWHAGATGNVGTSLSARRHLPTAIACLVVLLGPGSAAMHATQSAVGGHLDMLSMYLVASFAAAYAAMRWRRGGTGLLAVMFVGGVVFCELVGLWGADLPVVMYSGNAAFALLLIVATVLEVLIMRRGEARARRGYAYVSLASMLIAFAIWNATKTWLCDPYSPVQGHAIWHLLGAVSAYFLYRYYASEEADGVITTSRLTLTPFTIATARATAEGTRGDLRWADGFPRPDDQDAARMYLRAPDRAFGSWFITVQDNAEVVGTIGFFGPPDASGELTVGYGLVPAARQRGYATEALIALAEHGFAQPGVSRIVADPDLDNTASHRVLEKAGFVRTCATETSQWYERRRPGVSDDLDGQRAVAHDLLHDER